MYPDVVEFSTHEIDKDIMVLVADGGLNRSNRDEFVGQLESLIDGGVRRIIVDCSQLDYISSYGIGILILLHKKMGEKGGDVKIAALKGIVAQALQLTGLGSWFDIHQDVNRARLAFRNEEPTP